LNDPEHDGLARYEKSSVKEGRAGRKLENKACGKIEETGDLIFDPC
jgi:hypothetical protein